MSALSALAREAFAEDLRAVASDAWLLLSMLQVIFSEGLADEAAIASQSTGAQALRALCAEHTPEATEARTGVGAGS